MQKKCYGVRMRKNAISKELVKSDMQFLLLLLIQLDTGEKYEFHCCGRPNYSCQTWNLTERQSQRIYILFIRKCQEKSLEVDGIDMKKMTSATKSLTKNC